MSKDAYHIWLKWSSEAKAEEEKIEHDNHIEFGNDCEVGHYESEKMVEYQDHKEKTNEIDEIPESTSNNNVCENESKW